MIIPRDLRKQAKEYEAHGFHIVEVVPRAGSHFKVTFAEFTEPQFLTRNVGDPRAIKNNITRFRGLMKQRQEDTDES